MSSLAHEIRALPAPVGSRFRTLLGRVITAVLVVSPAVALGVALPLLWGHAVHLFDVVLGVLLYVVTSFGVTVGFHRLFTHRSFRSNRALKIVLATAGSMALEGSVISWVATHRRHHAYSDRPGDPHSPHRYGSGVVAQVRGFAFAHVGWLFRSDPTSSEHFAPDLLSDRDLVIISRLFPLLAIISLALPFALGWGMSGTVGGAVTALVWAGLVRMALLHHMSWSVNSVCHMFGRRPFKSRDRSTNFAPLAILSMGESWHNFHHACPSSARHGALPHQVDPSAGLIRLFERAGWATHVRWPTESRVRLAAAR